MLNQDVLKGKWKQMRGQVKAWWGDLTDDDLDTIDGNMDKLVGRLQERYGYAREDAEKEIDRRMKTFDSGTDPRKP
ncbi:MAG TPA: CsbD family protein [Candidatus Polarisedimenticolia bacterium]|jgi:uncharacterized protein YjbJ (UPF0337 family)|nr:CsbD family protein [Candidatus Polarisedimenticolia bacterium]